MNMKDMVVDSAKFSSSNWIKLLLLGLVIFIADKVNEISNFNDGTPGAIFIGIVVVGLFLGAYQAGFLFRIIEETTKGSEKMPRFDKFWDTFLHGIKEIIITMVYFIVPFILILISIFSVADFAGTEGQETIILLLVTALFLASLTYLVYQAAVLNMANHHGTIRSGFDFKSIFRKVREIGFKRLGFIYIITVILAFTVEDTIRDAVSIIPYDLGSVIFSFIIAPFILIFIARTLGLVNRTLEIERG